jgi:hypothetical protein
METKNFVIATFAIGGTALAYLVYSSMTGGSSKPAPELFVDQNLSDNEKITKGEQLARDACKKLAA